jgi:hypothetical protein
MGSVRGSRYKAILQDGGRSQVLGVKWWRNQVLIGLDKVDNATIPDSGTGYPPLTYKELNWQNIWTELIKIYA